MSDDVGLKLDRGESGRSTTGVTADEKTQYQLECEQFVAVLKDLFKTNEGQW